MLSFFRRGGAASILGGAIVFAIILVFALEFRPGRQGASASLAGQCAVRVYERCVDEKEYLAAYRLMAPPGAEAKALSRIGLRSHVLEGLTERELLLREAERLKIAISEDEIDAELTRGRVHVSLPVAYAADLAWQLGLCPAPRSPVAMGCDPADDIGIRLLPVTNTKTGKFDYGKYERVIRTTTNRGAKEFKEMQRSELIAERVRRLVQSRVRVSESEGFFVYERQTSKAVVRLVELKREWFAKFAADVSDPAVDAWVTDNREQVDHAWQAEQARFVAGCPMVSEILVRVPSGSDQEEEGKLRAQIDELRVRVDGGENFSQLAREASEGSTALVGGRLGCLSESYGEGAAELLAVVEKLQPKELSSVVRTARGFHVVKLHGKLGAADVELEGRRQVARPLAVRFQADELAQKFAAELIARVKAGAKLDEATDALARDYAMAHYAPPPARGRAKKPVAQGAEPEPDEPGGPPALDAPGRPRAVDSPPFSVASTPLPGASPGEDPARKAFALEPEALHPVPLATDDGWAVMQLKEKTLATREDFDEDKQHILARLRAAKAADALALYVQRLREAGKDKIKIDPALLKEPKVEREPGDDE